MNEPLRQSAIQANLIRRSQLLQAIRRFFIERGYIEVETPHRIPAPAPEAHIDAEPSGQWYLHTSPELCMKRLLAAGYRRIFQIGRCFRAKERGDRHLPEFTLLEWYGTQMNYADMMDETEALIRFAARSLEFGEMISWQGMSVDLGSSWERLTVTDAFERYAAKSVADALQSHQFDEILALEIEPNLGITRPVFLYDYPIACGALAKAKSDNPTVAERFELYIGGMELCNAFTELGDPTEQRDRFEKELQFRRMSGKPVYPMPERFLESLRFLPPCAGNALGVDRLAMLFANAAQIDDVTAFTTEEL